MAPKYDILGEMRVVAKEIYSQNRKFRKIVRARRWLMMVADLIEIYLNFQRDKDWDNRRWDDDGW